MVKKLENLQARAIKIIHHHLEYDQERGYMTIFNQKKFKVDLLIFNCVCKEITFQILRSMMKELTTIMVQEAIKLHCICKGLEQKLHKVLVPRPSLI